MAITNDKGETLFAVRWHAGMAGTDAIKGVWATCEDEAISTCVQEAWDWYYSFNPEEDEEERAELDLDIGAEVWDTEGIDPELGIWAEVWDDEVHPQEWPGGAKYSSEFV